MLSKPDVADWAGRELTDLYQQRIAFLRRVYDGSKLHLPFLQDLLGSLTVGAILPDDVLVMTGAEQAQDTGISRHNIFATLPAPPDPDLREALRDWLSRNGKARLAWLPEAGVGGIYSHGGSAACVNWQFFARDGKTLHAIEGARVAVGCRTTGTHLVHYDGTVLLVQTRTGIKTPTLNIQVQAWRGDHWSEPDRLLLRFAREVKLREAACAPTVACDSFKAKALKIARRYDRQPLPQALASRVQALSESDQTRFRQLKAAIQCGKEKFAIPEFGKNLSGWPDFGTEASSFPLRLNGALAIGCIGHSYLGWRTSADWAVGAWTAHDDKPVPLAVAVLGGQGAFLAAAPLEPAIATR